MKKPKFIADQYEMTLDRPFQVYDKVMVTPSMDDTFAFNKPIFGQIVGIISRDQMNVPIQPVYAIKEEKTLKDYLVYAWQCKLRK